MVGGGYKSLVPPTRAGSVVVTNRIRDSTIFFYYSMRTVAQAGSRLRNRSAANEIAYDILARPFYLQQPGVDIYVVPMRRPGWTHHEVVKEIVRHLNPHGAPPFAAAYAQFPYHRSPDDFFKLSEALTKLDRADLTKPVALRGQLSGRNRNLLGTLPAVFQDTMHAHGCNPLETFAESTRIFFPLQVSSSYPRPYRLSVGLQRKTLDTAGRLALALQFGIADGPEAAEHIAKMSTLLTDKVAELAAETIGSATAPTFYSIWLHSNELLTRMYEFAPIATHFLHILPAKAAVARLVSQLRSKSRIWRLGEEDVLWRGPGGKEAPTGYRAPTCIIPYPPNYEPGGNSKRVCPGRFDRDGFRELTNTIGDRDPTPRDELFETYSDPLYVRYPRSRSNRAVLLFVDPLAVPAVHSVLRDFEASGRIDFADEARFLRSLIGISDGSDGEPLLLDRLKNETEAKQKAKEEAKGADSESEAGHNGAFESTRRAPTAFELGLMSEPDGQLEGHAAGVQRARDVLDFLYELPPATGEGVPDLTLRAKFKYLQKRLMAM